MILMLSAALLGIGALGFIKYRQIRKAMAQGASFAPPPAGVSTVVARAAKWQPVLKAVGSLKAVQGVEVSTDLAGIVREIGFESGARVKKGDVLVRLDTQQEEAQLKSAEAAAALARVNRARQVDLLAKRATSQAEHDSAKATADQAEAAVEQVKALIARKTIAAPFDGVLGLRQVNIGQYLDVGKPIVVLQSQDPIYVEFALPQQELAQVAIGKKVRVAAPGLEGTSIEGEITAINSKVDESTRNIQVEATLPNREGSLRGGMFVQVEVLLPEQEGVISIPASSVNYAPFGDSVFIVRDGEGGKKKVQQQFVKLGPARGDQVSILSGVKEGDEVVSSGAFKLNSGAAVTINNSVQPSNEAAPHPPES